MQNNLTRLEAEMRNASNDTDAALAAWEAGATREQGRLYQVYETAYDRFARLAMDVAETPARNPGDVAAKLRSILLLAGAELIPVDAIERMVETALVAVAPPMSVAA